MGGHHFVVCKRHRLAWYVGANLFSSWRDEDEATWDRNEEVIRTCREVEDPYPPVTLSMRIHYRIHCFLRGCRHWWWWKCRLSRAWSAMFHPDHVPF